MPDQERNGVTRRRLVRGLGLAGVATLAGCNRFDIGSGTGNSNATTAEGGADQPTETPTTVAEPSGTLTVGLSDSPDGYDPETLSVGRGRHLLSNVYQALYTYDERTGLVPQLAADSPGTTDDGLTYRVRLADGARFHDGSRVTAGDVKDSFDSLTDRVSGGPVSLIDSVEATDGRTATFSLTDPYAPFGHVLAAGAVTSEGAMPTATGDGMPPGTGPFRIAGTDGNAVRLERWDDYWGSPESALSGATLVRVSEPTVRLNNLRAGENDVIEETHPTIWDQIESTDRAELVRTPGLRYFYVGFNCNEGPAADPAVREAVDYCVDLDDAVEKFVEPTSSRLYSPLPKPVAAEWELPTDEWTDLPHERDVEKATDLLSGTDSVPDGWTPRIIAPETETYERLAIAVANGLGEAGYEPDIRRMSSEEFADAHVSGDADTYDVFLSEWTGLPDPDAFTYPLFAQEAEGSTNGTYYRNDTVEQKLSRGRRESDREARATLYGEAITTLLSDRVHLPIYTRNRGFGVRDYVEDFAAHPVLGFTLVSGHNNVTMEE